MKQLIKVEEEKDDNLFIAKKAELNALGNLALYQPTWAFQQFIHLRHKTIALFTGNQSMKTSSCAYQYILRIFGWHPVPEKNILYFECPLDHKFTVRTLPKDWICPICRSEIKIHKRGSRVFRFASDVLPGEKANVRESISAEVKNTVYPEFLKWLPPVLLKRDIQFRNMAMIIHDPNVGKTFCDEQYNEGDIIVEFVSYKQTVQEGAGVQRVSVWEDEEPPYEFHEEQLMRLMAEDGDLLLSLTPANRLSWTYSEVFERAAVYIRTPIMCEVLGRESNMQVEQIERTESPHNIAVIQAASDDNPTLKKEVIDQRMDDIADPNTRDTRRYGIHHQIKGRIFREWSYDVHFIDPHKYLPDGIPENWVHARGIDYHAQVPWACGCISLSPENEAFIWCEYQVSPSMRTTFEICRTFSILCLDYKFTINLIDPEAVGTKKDNISVLDDINHIFFQLKRDDIGTGGYWQTWDTKGEKGRKEIQDRLKNSKIVKRPFSNLIIRDGREIRLPTIWVFNTCKLIAEFFRKWSWEEYTDMVSRQTKEAKNKPQQKWSHFPMVFEAIFKHPAFKPRSRGTFSLDAYEKKRYFQRQRYYR